MILNKTNPFQRFFLCCLFVFYTGNDDNLSSSTSPLLPKDVGYENIPNSHRSHGLPQAAPKVAQHSDFSVAPLMLTSQRPSWMLSQQVPFRLSAVEQKTIWNCHSKKSWHAMFIPPADRVPQECRLSFKRKPSIKVILYTFSFTSDGKE